eukprot:s1487_g3.t1
MEKVHWFLDLGFVNLIVCRMLVCLEKMSSAYDIDEQNCPQASPRLAMQTWADACQRSLTSSRLKKGSESARWGNMEWPTHIIVIYQDKQ